MVAVNELVENFNSDMSDEEPPNPKYQPLAPPSTEISKVKSPIALYWESTLIFWMFFVTMFFKMFRSIQEKSKKSVRGKVILITGTGRGLGRELALRFAKLGAKLVCVDVDKINNDETVRLIQYKVPGTTAKAYTVNVADAAEVAALAVKVESDLGPVDVLINNAAVLIGHTFLGGTNQAIAAIININLLSHFWMVRTFLPSMMKRNSGHIVGISSSSALSAVSKLSVYSASMCGIKGMMESLREELRENKLNQIKTTVVMPKLINTSADYMKYINSRSPVLSIDQAAEETVNGILIDEVQFTIPSKMNFVCSFLRILPTNIVDSIKNVFYVKLTMPRESPEGFVPYQNMTIINKTISKAL